jgi:hypothetical protein
MLPSGRSPHLHDLSVDDTAHDEQPNCERQPGRLDRSLARLQMVHMLRIFFTGAFRKPREVN